MNTNTKIIEKEKHLAESFIDVPESADIETQRMLAELQASILLARANPRDEIAAIERIMNACSRTSVAEHAEYEYSRGYEMVSGASISLVRTIARCWGSIESGFRVLGTLNGETSVYVYAWDLESNVKSSMIITVPLIRETSKGSYPLTKQRDIYEHVANMASRRLRACLLAVLPDDVVADARAACAATLSKSDQMKPGAISNLINAFLKFGVTRAHIENYIGRRLESITNGQVVRLRKIFVSLEEGSAAPADWFKLDNKSDSGSVSRVDSIKDKLKKIS